ncbi:hypothetical protein GCM10022631_25890 [Deinococcus rubellus]|uniref:DUF4388 domain-containing protein n=1 Tax=Deinococcus rubellus TaxID=1889240 RepID=A0ABY5YI59_9DEIO|nr:DUF4388 domain-containing protein [Deinococcus rubellus]UWX63954.1 DUF4388 domain-containing protein [Deinococcus rubellus]
MTLLGKLEQFAFIDLFKFIRHQSGVLLLHGAYQDRTLELYLEAGMLRALYADGFQIQERLRVREVIYHLVTQPISAFEFDNRKVQPSETLWLDMDLGELLDKVVQSAQIPEDQLPAGHEKFVAEPLTRRVPDTLSACWQQLQPLLRAGASATDVAQHLPYSEREVRLMLRDLRAVGLVVPQRHLVLRHQFAARLQAGPADQSATASAPSGTRSSTSLRATIKRLTESFH